MKIKKIICCITAALLMTGCTKFQKSSSPDSYDKEEINSPINIYDMDDNVIGQIERYGKISLLDDKLFYP